MIFFHLLASDSTRSRCVRKTFAFNSINFHHKGLLTLGQEWMSREMETRGTWTDLPFVCWLRILSLLSNRRESASQLWLYSLFNSLELNFFRRRKSPRKLFWLNLCKSTFLLVIQIWFRKISSHEPNKKCTIERPTFVQTSEEENKTVETRDTIARASDDNENTIRSEAEKKREEKLKSHKPLGLARNRITSTQRKERRQSTDPKKRQAAARLCEWVN